eukprot:GAFH01000181.1.p6 GENE.GAFH01000181.1~~GAFH01000181.1.p6  ORF type:complete len:52 (+),score=6.30 GAFH01000181.1:735-890(+)
MTTKNITKLRENIFHVHSATETATAEASSSSSSANTSMSELVVSCAFVCVA